MERFSGKNTDTEEAEQCELELVHLLLEPVNSSEVVIKIPTSEGLGCVNCLLQCLTLFKKKCFSLFMKPRHRRNLDGARDFLSPLLTLHS